MSKPSPSSVPTAPPPSTVSHAFHALIDTTNAFSSRSCARSMELFETSDVPSSSSSSSNSSLSSRPQTSSSSPLSSRSDDVVELDLKPQLAFAKFAGAIFSPSGKLETTATADGQGGLPSSVRLLPMSGGLSGSSGNTIRMNSNNNTSNNNNNKGKSDDNNNNNSAYFESPIDKFNRLKREIYDFQQDLNSLLSTLSTSKSPSSPPTDSTAKVAETISNELFRLDEKITELLVDKKYRSLLAEDADIIEEIAKAANVSATGSNGNMSMSDIIERLKKVGEGIPKVNSGQEGFVNEHKTAGPSSPSPSSSSSDSSPPLAVISSLDRRLAALEKSIGIPVGIGQAVSPKPTVPSVSSVTNAQSLVSSSSDSKMSGGNVKSSVPSSHLQSAWSSLGSSFPDLYSGVMSLHRKIMLLEPGKMESINRAIKAIMGDLEMMETAKGASSTGSAGESGGNTISSPLQQQKINELYDLLPRWDSAVLQLPSIINRLQSLKSLHESSAALAEREKSSHIHLMEVTKMVAEDSEFLQKLNTSLSENAKQIEQNFKGMEEKMKKLAERIDKIK